MFKKVNQIMHEYKFEKSFIVLDNGLDKLTENFLKTGHNFFHNISLETIVYILNSQSNLMLQFADFCAYSYTRQQYLAKHLTKNQREGKEIDPFIHEVYECVTRVVKNFYDIEFIKGKYDDEIEEKGRYTKWLVENTRK